MKQYLVLLSWLCLGVILACGCGEDDPEDNSGNDTDSNGEDRDVCIDDAMGDYTEDVSHCTPLESDYRPRDPGADNWEACISDDNTYHRIEESISSIARVEAYDAMGDLLWNNPQIPTAQDFIDARIALDAEQGLGSRIDRRYDVHYNPPADGAACDEEGVAAANPDYCVGPAVIRPIINAAFADVANGGVPIINAEIIHGAIQWFLYVSAIKESTTCTDTAKDCDSAWAYYTGGTERVSPIGLAAEIMDVAPETHNRAYDGVLGVRCWRDLDSGETAIDLELRDRAILQYDVALLHGVSILIRQRFVALSECEDATEKTAVHESLKVLIPLFDRETRSRDAAAADLLAAEIAKETDQVDTIAAIAAIDSIYLCP